MSLTGVENWFTTQAGAALSIIVIIIVLFSFVKRDFKNIFIAAIIGGFVWLLITNGDMVYRSVGNIARMVFG